MTEVPTGPEVADKLVMPGVTVKFALLLARFPTVTTIGAAPRPRLLGTTNWIAALPQVAGVIGVPSMVTVLVP